MDAVELPGKLGILGDRNAGVERLRGLGGVDILVVLDDGALLPKTDTFRLILETFESNRGLGIVSFRIADETGFTQRRHVPRLGASDPTLSGEVTTFLGGHPHERDRPG
ncbi:hypothetical protein GCM10009759_75020 [Kitasatospora saccharophila]|uniref:Resolvase-like protein n=1 Tax=Kitasatospora saccharophila TaxID=407973 RepID=A0ABP5K264_9ACTN